MSGLEVIGGISAIITIIEASLKVWERAQKGIRLPKTFETVARRLPFLLSTLQICHDQLDAVKATLPNDIVESIKSNVRNCKVQAQTLREIFEETIPGENASRLERYRVAVKSVGKGKRVEEILKSISEDTHDLASYYVVKSARPDFSLHLKELISELETIESSIDTERISSKNSYSTNYSDQQNSSTGNAHSLGPGDKHIYGPVGAINQYTYHIHEGSNEDDCRRAFKTSPYTSYKDNPNPNRAKGTCLWALNHENFQKWRQNGENDLLWISADPGCGKSVFSRSLIDELREQGEVAVCYFFFKDNGEQNNLCTALCAVLHQLICDQPSLICQALPAWNSNKNALTNEPNEMWRILLTAAISIRRDIICVFDALDECQEDDRRQLINRLRDFRQAQSLSESAHSLKFLVTSRPYDNVQRWFHDVESEFPHVRVRGEDENLQIGKEINIVIDQQVQKLGSEFKLGLDIQKRLRDCLESMQHRTYLWLHLALDEIRNKYRRSLNPSKVSIEDLALPRNVEEAYEHMLQKTDHTLSDRVRRILLTIIGARRPLSSEEMYIVLSLTETRDKNVLDLTDFEACRFESQLRDWCGLFVFIVDSRLFLIHQTAKEYLIANTPVMPSSIYSWKSCFSLPEVETEMVRCCIAFLELEENDTILSKMKDHERDLQYELEFQYRQSCRPHSGILDLQRTRFLEYCIEFWVSHLEGAACFTDQDLCQRIFHLLTQRRDLFDIWSKQLWSKELCNGPEGLQAQHVLSKVGCLSALRCLGQGGPVDWNIVCDTGESALHIAVNCGHVSTARCLIELGADVNLRTGPDWDSRIRSMRLLSGQNASSYFPMCGSEMHRTVDSEPIPRKESTPFCLASKSGNRKMIDLLLENGADEKLEENRDWLHRSFWRRK